jgi:excisionase family DNA binding protein
MSDLISATETANRLGVSLWTVYRWARGGQLVSIQLGRRRLFSEEDVQDVIRRGRNVSPSPVGRERGAK